MKNIAILAKDQPLFGEFLCVKRYAFACTWNTANQYSYVNLPRQRNLKGTDVTSCFYERKYGSLLACAAVGNFPIDHLPILYQFRNYPVAVRQLVTRSAITSVCIDHSTMCNDIESARGRLKVFEHLGKTWKKSRVSRLVVRKICVKILEKINSEKFSKARSV